MSVNNVSQPQGASSTGEEQNPSSLPLMDSNSGAIPPWFNANIPLSYTDPYIDPTDTILGRLGQMIIWMSANPTNLNTPGIFLQYASNLLNDKSLTPAQEAQIQNLLTSSNLQDGSGNSVLDQAIQAEWKLYVVQNPTATVAQVQTFLNGIGSMFPSGVGVDTYIASITSGTIAMFIQSVTSGSATEETVASIWGTGLSNWNINKWTQSLLIDEVGTANNDSDAGGTQAMLLYLLPNLEADQNNLIGYGATARWLTEEIRTLNGLTSEWSTGGFTATSGPNSALTFVQNLINFKNSIDMNPLANGGKNPPAPGSLADSIDQSLNSILNLQTTIIDPNTQQPETIKDLYTSGDGADLAKALNASSLSGSDGPAASYTTISNAFKSAMSQLTNQSSTVTTEMTQMSNDIQAWQSILQQLLKDQVALNNTIVRNQISSS